MGFLANVLLFLLLIVGVLLMFIVLIQRGRGGGLAGAFGGAGGQSAFGTKAGDVFTKITVGFAVTWVLLAGTAGLALRYAGESGRAKRLDEDLRKSEQPAAAAGAKDDEEQVPTGTSADETRSPGTESGQGETKSEAKEPEAEKSTEAPRGEASPPANENNGQ